MLSASHEGGSVDVDGRYESVKGAKVLFPPLQQPYPPVWFGGSSDAAQVLAAKHVDTYLTWGEPPAAVADKIGQVRRLAAAQGRELKFGIRLHVIVRETEEEAWAAADALISHVDDATVDRARAAFGNMDSEGQRRMSALHEERDAARPRLARDQPRTCGPAWAWYVGARARRSSAAPSRWRRACANTKPSASTPSSSPATRTSKKRTASPTWCSRTSTWPSRASVTGPNFAGPFGEVIANLHAPSQAPVDAAVPAR